MKTFRFILRLFTYIAVAALASCLTLATTEFLDSEKGPSKLIQLEELILEKYIGEADRTEMEDAAAEAMVEALDDRWSYYIPAAEYADYVEQMANSYVGIGVTIQATDSQEGFLITKVNEGGPADTAGILPGDRIIKVDGTDVRGFDSSQTSALVKGEPDTIVQITVVREEKEILLDVVRKQVDVPVATCKMLPDGIGLITITNFDSRCADETIAAIDTMLEQGAGKLIFDVRFNPGGYVSELVAVLDYILPKGDLFRSVNYAGKEQLDTSDAKCIQGIPMAVLVNGESYSAAEFFAAALREYDYASIVGEPTVGKGYFQVTHKLSDGSAVGLSIGKYYTPKGVSLAEAGGIIPDVVVTVDEDMAMEIYAGMLDPAQDPQIQAAVDLLNK